MKPSEQISKALEGELELTNIDPASISNMRFQIYKIACEILAVPSNSKRKDMIESYPEGIQTLIRAECRRIYDYRKNNLPNMPSTINQSTKSKY